MSNKKIDFFSSPQPRSFDGSPLLIQLSSTIPRPRTMRICSARLLWKERSRVRSASIPSSPAPPGKDIENYRASLFLRDRNTRPFRRNGITRVLRPLGRDWTTATKRRRRSCCSRSLPKRRRRFWSESNRSRTPPQKKSQLCRQLPRPRVDVTSAAWRNWPLRRSNSCLVRERPLTSRWRGGW